MNHEFLLKPELPVNPASPIRTQTVADSQSRVESEPRQAFSSELDKQIDKQVPQSTTSKQSGVIAKGSEPADSVKPVNEAKAEIIVDKNGKPLPTEKEIVQELTAQLLGDFDGDAATKKELTEVIEQFVHNIVSNETPGVDLKDGVAQFINQLLQSGFGSDKAAVLSTVGEVKTDLKSAVSGASDITKIIAPALTTATLSSAASSASAESAQKQAVIEGGGRDSALKQEHVEGSKQKLVPTNLVQVDPENIERVQSVIQQIKGIVTTEVSAKIDDKGDKTQLISNLVKQLLAKLPAQESVSKQAATVDAVDKVAAGHVQSATLRSDILQALTSKASAVTTNNNDLVAKATTVIINNDTSIAKMTSITVNKDPLLTITNSILKGEISSVNADEKHIDKISQLVDLLRPAKSDEQLGRTAILEKAAPAVSSPLIATTPLVSTSSITKTDGPSLDIQPSLQSKAWNNVLSSRVIWMAREGIQQAALKLNPANLGPVEVRLNMHNEQANITFIAHNAATRDALEQALPKLRESFLENGIELTDAEVSDPSSQQTQDDGEQGGDNIDSGESNATVIDNTNENNDAAATLKDDADLGLSVYA